VTIVCWLKKVVAEELEVKKKAEEVDVMRKEEKSWIWMAEMVPFMFPERVPFLCLPLCPLLACLLACLLALEYSRVEWVSVVDWRHTLRRGVCAHAPPCCSHSLAHSQTAHQTRTSSGCGRNTTISFRHSHPMCWTYSDLLHISLLPLIVSSTDRTEE